MAKTKFDITSIKTEAQRGLHAGVGAADLAIETVKDVRHRGAEAGPEAVRGRPEGRPEGVHLGAEVRQGLEFQPKALRSQATTVVSSRVDELSKDAKARRTAIEKRVVDLQTEARSSWPRTSRPRPAPTTQLAKRGEKVVKRIRKETASVADPGPVKKSTGTTVTKPPGQEDHGQEGPGQEDDRQEGSGQEGRRQVTH